LDRARAIIGGAPPRLREIFNVLYVDSKSQREAAHVLGVSQPRVAALHQRLLVWGRIALQSLNN